MTTGTGIDAQLGYRLETTVGTEVTPNKFLEFNSEGLDFDPTWLEPTGIRTGQKFKNNTRLAQSLKKVAGPIDVPYAFRTMGGLWKAAIGSSVTTPTLVGPAAAYKQVHQSGDLLGKSLTVQVGRPEAHGSQAIRPHTIRGAKVTDWEFSCSDSAGAKLVLGLDGWDETTATALAAASFVSDSTNGEFNFTHCSAFSLGGTIGGTTELTYTGGTAVATIVKGITIKGDNALDVERYGLGNAGLKKEQLEGGVPVITITLDAEYNQAEFYTPFKAGTATSLLCRFEASTIETTYKNTIEFIVPVARIKKVTPQVSGPEVVKAQVELEVYANATNNPFQVLLISQDSVAI
ncbi:phage tail tube protein [Nocardioides stalactiti]|uniref:phage tail tube protein n=1 Tax=Nocardioides stalactiti TaxID=2755356 RepID=UPI001601ABA5|nr:phage tail tube protein [Nocardioides stalactiti]